MFGNRLDLKLCFGRDPFTERETPYAFDLDDPKPIVKKYPVVQVNGVRIYGPPKNWPGNEPSTNCEIFVKGVPKHYTEEDLIPQFERFGQIYTLRLMMNYDNRNRGYLFVKYAHVIEANRALEVMQHYFSSPHNTYQIEKSFDKCRLYVGNIPKNIPLAELQKALQCVFPQMTKIHFCVKNSTMSSKNRGYVFMDFETHSYALQAKQMCVPSLMMFDKDLRVAWADPEAITDDDEDLDDCKTLFIRNVHLKLNTKDMFNIIQEHVSSSEIYKVSRSREFCFVDFKNRETAEFIKEKLSGFRAHDKAWEIEWAKPPKKGSLHTLKKKDFNSILKLKCLANDWTPPIIVYGRVYEMTKKQYVGVLIKNGDIAHTIIIELEIDKLNDIHLRLSEVILAFINKYGKLSFPQLFVKVKNDVIQIVGLITQLNSPEFVAANNVNQNIPIYWDEIVDLSRALYVLSQMPFAVIHACYRLQMSLNNKTNQLPYMNYSQFSLSCDRILGCIRAHTLNIQPLPYELGCSEILFALCDSTTKTNFLFSHKYAIQYSILDLMNMQLQNQFKDNNCLIDYGEINLLPVSFVQDRNRNYSLCRGVLFGEYIE